MNSNQPGRGSGRGIGRGGRGGRNNNNNPNPQHGGNGRGGRGNSSFYSGRNTFYPQAKMYSQQEWQNMSRDQKKMVEQVKINQGWKYGNTPPHGYVIDNVIGLAVSANHGARSIPNINSFAPLPLPPPPPSQVPQPPSTNIPNCIQVPQGSAGSMFGRRNNDDAQSRTSTISRVTIDGRVYVNGPVYDANGNLIN